jgi:hypothetical protein
LILEKPTGSTSRRAAVRQFRKLDPIGRRRIQAAVELLGDDPRPTGAKKLASATTPLPH